VSSLASVADFGVGSGARKRRCHRRANANSPTDIEDRPLGRASRHDRWSVGCRRRAVPRTTWSSAARAAPLHDCLLRRNDNEQSNVSIRIHRDSKSPCARRAGQRNRRRRLRRPRDFTVAKLVFRGKLRRGHAIRLLRNAGVASGSSGGAGNHAPTIYVDASAAGAVDGITVGHPGNTLESSGISSTAYTSNASSGVTLLQPGTSVCPEQRISHRQLLYRRRRVGPRHQLLERTPPPGDPFGVALAPGPGRFVVGVFHSNELRSKPRNRQRRPSMVRARK
jgi:hypothetical protein